MDGRFYIPLFLLLIPVAILAAEWAMSNVLKLRFSLSTVAVLAVLLLSCLGYPSQSGFKPEKHRFQAWDALQYAKAKGMSRQYEAQKQFATSFQNAPGIVLSDTDSAVLERFTQSHSSLRRSMRNIIIVIAAYGITAKLKRVSSSQAPSPARFRFTRSLCLKTS